MMTFIPVIMAANNNRRRREEEERRKQEEKRDQEELCTNLLLTKGENETMEIGTMEKVKTATIICDYDSEDPEWFVYIKGKKKAMKNFDACLQKIIKKYKPIRFQIIPHSVDVEYSIVDAYRVILVVNESQEAKDTKYENERCFR